MLSIHNKMLEDQITQQANSSSTPLVESQVSPNLILGSSEIVLS